MKQATRSWWLTLFSLVLSLPTALFIIIATLKYELNVPGPFDSMAPFLESAGISETIGWNINLLILFGPVAALILCAFQVLQITWEFDKEHFRFQFIVRRKWFTILVAAFSASLIGFLFIYMVGENCICPS